MGRTLLGLSVCLIIALSGAPAVATELNISAAASMKEALRALSADFRVVHPGVQLRHNLAASGTLAKQIANGAPADLFISANTKWMDYLVEQGRVAPAAVIPLAYNALVVVGQPGRSLGSLQDLLALRRIALGSPASVPAGQYAAQALAAAGVFGPLQDRGRLVLAKDVRQALMYADRGEADAALVYRTDALLAQRAVVLLTVPQALYPRICYPSALTVDGTQKAEARAFAAYLQSPPARGILQRFGFEVP